MIHSSHLKRCEILGMHRKNEPAVLAAHFLLYYKQRGACIINSV